MQVWSQGIRLPRTLADPQRRKTLNKEDPRNIDMEEPINMTQLRSFLGMVTYYRDMWPKRSCVISPLTELMGSKEYKWGPPQDKSFKQMNVVIAKDTLLAYADHNKKFYIKTDASNYQLRGRYSFWNIRPPSW